jgi:hypothetical protein
VAQSELKEINRGILAFQAKFCDTVSVPVEYRYRGRAIGEAEIAFLRELTASHPELSRRALSRRVCEAWQWKQANGAAREMVCRSLMLELHRAGHIELPPIRRTVRNPLAEREKPEPVVPDNRAVRGPLRELGTLDIHQVRRTPQEALFNSLMEQYHYLGYEHPVGEQLKFLVYAKGQAIACLAWSSAVRHLASRDSFIGWSPETRKRNLHLIAYNSRFLLLPWAAVPHLASHILGRMAKLVPIEWRKLYAHPIYYLETFIDPARFKGTCYRAANWMVLGRTTGRGKNAPSNKPRFPVKEVLGLPLTPRFREWLNQ